MADSAIITRRSALVGALSSLFLPPAALALIEPAVAGQVPMTAMERADFHMAEFAKAMDEMLSPKAHRWGASLSGGHGGFQGSRQIFFRVPDPDNSARMGKERLIERIAEFR
jgi:hypothetical protein